MSGTGGKPAGDQNGAPVAGGKGGSSLGKDFLVAGALFTATIYAPFVIASQMIKITGDASSTGFRISLVLVMLSMALGTMLSSSFTRLPLVIAPAVGLTTLLADIHHSVLDGEELYWASALAAVAVLVANLNLIGGTKSIRHYVLDEMPPAIRAGVAGGVGALLAETAIRNVEDNGRLLGAQGSALIFITAALIFAADFVSERLKARATANTSLIGLLSSGLKLSYLILPILMILILLRMSPNLIGSLQPGSALHFQQFFARFGLGGTLDSAPGVILTMVFAPLIAFIVVADVVGTPFQMLDPGRLSDSSSAAATGPQAAEGSARDSDRGKLAVRRSFFVDTFVMGINAWCHIPPPVYYAENHVLHSFEPRDWLWNPRPAFIYAGLLFVLAALAVFLRLPADQFGAVSELMVAPVLFVVGTRVIAHALSADRRAEGPVFAGEDLWPAAIIVVLTPVPNVGLEWSLPIGITFHWLRKLILRSGLTPVEHWLGGGASAALAIMLAVEVLPPP